MFAPTNELKHQLMTRSNLPSQIGSFPDHTPFCWQVLMSVPTWMRPSMQVYTATELKVVVVKLMVPLSGAVRLPQSATAGINEHSVFP